MIVFIRIDDRLIHGQVVVGWVNEVKANHIVVVNDDVARDDGCRSLMKMAVPSSIKVSFLTVSEAPDKLKNSNMEKDKVLLLVNNPSDLLNMAKKGFAMRSINVGGMRFSAGKREILKSVFVSNKDIEALKKLSSFDINIESRAVPTDRIVDVISLLKN